MREPKWIVGAYAQAPDVQNVSGRSRATGYVEAWRGTPEEFLSPARELLGVIDRDEKAHVDALATWADGTSQAYKSLDELQKELESCELEHVLAVRITCASHSHVMAGTLVGRPLVPGLYLDVEGADKSLVLGAAQLVFRRMMIGYVDRMGGWRALAWMVSAIAPLVLISIGVSAGEASVTARLMIILAASIGSIATFLVIGPYFRVSRGLQLVAHLPATRWSRSAMLLLRFGRDGRTRVALRILGALVLGVLGNKLADLLSWP